MTLLSSKQDLMIYIYIYIYIYILIKEMKKLPPCKQKGCPVHRYIMGARRMDATFLVEEVTSFYCMLTKSWHVSGLACEVGPFPCRFLQASREPKCSMSHD
jgi:hypothetical protein